MVSVTAWPRDETQLARALTPAPRACTFPRSLSASVFGTPGLHTVASGAWFRWPIGRIVVVNQGASFHHGVRLAVTNEATLLRPAGRLEEVSGGQDSCCSASRQPDAD